MIYLVTSQERLFEASEYCIISVERSLELLEPLEIVGFDTETTGLDPWADSLLLVQLGNFDFQVVIDCTTVNITRYKEYLESSRLFIGCNLKFDLRFLLRKKIVMTNVFDVFLAEKLMYLGYPAGMHGMSLQALGVQYCNVELDKSVRGKIIWAGIQPDVVVYGANDVKYLEQIYQKQLECLKEKELEKAITIENRFVIPLSYCEYCGIHLDKELWLKKMEHDKLREEAALEDCNNWIINYYNSHKDDPSNKVCKLIKPYIVIQNQGDLFLGFDLSPKVVLNWNSSKQLIPLFQALGIDTTARDKEKGGTKDSIDAKILKPQSDKCPLISIYLNYKEATKVTSTYGQNFLDQINPTSGRIHTNYQQLGADTTRITSGGKDKSAKKEYVNLLNLPADAETRACFTAESGNKWISIDYSGQETYLMASIANDTAIIEELTNGSGDIHSLTAYIAYPEIPRDTPIKDIKKLYHNLRQEAKGIEFAINYGGNENTISQNKGIPIEEARKIYKNYMSGFSGLQRYQAYRRKDWWDKGYILLNPATGHKAYIYDYSELKNIDSMTNKEGFWEEYRVLKNTNPYDSKVQDIKRLWKRKAASSRQSINYPIQATGSMCLRFSLIFFFQYLKKNDLLFDVKICVTPYDEINIEAPEHIAEDVARELYNCMVKAGAVFCTRCKLDADISRLSLCIKDFTYNNETLATVGDAVNIGEDFFENVTLNKKWPFKVKATSEFFNFKGPLPNYWIH